MYKTYQYEVNQVLPLALRSHWIVGADAISIDVLDGTLMDYNEFLDQNPCPEDVIGVAVTVGSVGYVLDLFGKPSTCRHYLRQKIHSAMAVSLCGVGRVRQASTDKLEEEVDELPESHWTSVGTVGLGRERRTITRHRSHVTAFDLADIPVHVNLVSMH